MCQSKDACSVNGQCPFHFRNFRVFTSVLMAMSSNSSPYPLPFRFSYKILKKKKKTLIPFLVVLVKWALDSSYETCIGFGLLLVGFYSVFCFVLFVANENGHRRVGTRNGNFSFRTYRNFTNEYGDV